MLNIKDVRISPVGANSFAAFVQGGNLVADGIQVENAPNITIYAEKAEVQVGQIVFSGAGKDAIEGANVVRLGIYGGAISSAGRFALDCDGQGTVSVEDVSIELSIEAAIFIQKGTKLNIQYAKIVDSASDGIAVNAEILNVKNRNCVT